MTFAQRRNRLTTHFSLRIPVVKRRMTLQRSFKICTYVTTNNLETSKKELNCRTESDRTAKFPFDETWGSYTYLLTYLLTHSMVQSPSREANWFAASQEIPRIFMEPEGSLPHSKACATCPCPGPAQSSPHTHIPSPEDPS